MMSACAVSSPIRRKGHTTPAAMHLAAAIMSLAFIAFSVISAAAQSVAETEIADGEPWHMESDDGRTMTLILFADGSGRMTGGPMNLSPKWRPTEDGLCLKPAALMREQCVTLVPTADGYVATRNGATVFVLKR